jgi:ketosteroid isomerase-like protein
MANSREDAVRAATQRWLDATVRADVDALEGMLEPTYTFTHATTAVMDTREEWLDYLRSGRRRYKSWQIFDVSVRLFDRAAVMTGRGHQEIVRDDGVIDLRTSFTNVWIEHDGRWLLAVWQATLVPKA